jgi:hypothetical protein
MEMSNLKATHARSPGSLKTQSRQEKFGFAPLRLCVS